MKSILGFCIIFISLSVTATLPEPDVIVYGKVINRYGGVKAQLTKGTLTWQIQKQGSADAQIYTTQLQSLADGKYSYRLAIPQQIVIKSLPVLQDLANNDAAINATAKAHQFNLIAVEVDEQTATIVPPTKSWLKLGQGQRGQAVEIDLQISAPFKDSDGDGMPNIWEERFGLNITKNDAQLDKDKDGLSNLEEFTQATDPAHDNKVPSLAHTKLKISEQGWTQLRLPLIDSDTAPQALWITLEKIPAGIKLYAFGTLDGGQVSGEQLKNGARLSWRDVMHGNIRLHHTTVPTAWSPVVVPAPLTFTMDDGEHPPVRAQLKFELFHPNYANAASIALWLDASVNPAPFAEYEAQEDKNENIPHVATPAIREEWYGRTSNPHQQLDVAHRIALDGRTPLAMTRLTAKNSLPMLQLQGDSYLSYYQPTFITAPFSMSGNNSLFMVMRAEGNDTQVLINDPANQLSITGKDFSPYSKRLCFKFDEFQSIYSSKVIDKNLGIIGLFKEGDLRHLELNSSYAGGFFPVKDFNYFGTSYSIGGWTSGSSFS